MKSASVEEFGKIELKVIKLVVSYCCYFIKGLPRPSAEYQAIKTQENYYHMARQLSTKGKLRVGSAKLSSVIKDSKMAEIIRSIEA
ncbi:hypothetical protein [Microcoleus sp. CAWBG58]|uniref:hypothetical protein n=1 Tax=Microcoleus sp. CAWBG58 TaxID=2841651 RepID=UPI0025E0EE38|nr:hypothetical protein [Microcoleus sp. CAWBG58]